MPEENLSSVGDGRGAAGWEVPGRGPLLTFLTGAGRDDVAALLSRLLAADDHRVWPGLGPAAPWGALPQEALPLAGHTLVMGIVNVTPDSFSDGGAYLDPEAAIRHGLELVQAGADVLDVGGESTRPWSEPVSAEEEKRRVVPVIRALADRVQVPISIDTSKAEVAAAALEAGASIVNDVTALDGDEGMVDVVAAHRAGLILMHMKGRPRDMQANPRYDNVLGEIILHLAQRLERAAAGGVDLRGVWVDPGIGFGKTMEHNLEIFASLRALRALGQPVLLGPSRKSFLGDLLRLDVTQRLEGTAATVALAAAQGVHMVRVHDVEAMVRVARTADAIVRGWRPHRVYLSLGSNMGDRHKNLQAAVAALARLPRTWVERCSSVYETAPVGYEEQPSFLNAAVELRTELDPRRLLRETQAIEKTAGRVRDGVRWGPRPLDVDILLVDGVESGEPWLTLPHPRMEERGFVLVPLAEIAPGLHWAGASVEDRLRALRERGHLETHPVQRVHPPLPVPAGPDATA